MVVLKLEGTSYYQDWDTMKTYIDHFMELLDLVEYHEINDTDTWPANFTRVRARWSTLRSTWQRGSWPMTILRDGWKLHARSQRTGRPTRHLKA